MTAKPTPLKTDRRTVVTNIITLFLGSAIAQGLTALLLILTARQLGPAAYGQYASSMALATSLSIIFSLGLNLWLLREGGQQPSLIGSLLGSVLAVKMPIGLAWLVLIWIVAPFIKINTMTAALIGLAAMLVLVNNLFDTVLTGFKAILRNRINTSLDVVTEFAQLLLTLVMIRSGADQAADFIKVRALVFTIALLAALGIAGYLLQLRPSLRTARRALLQSPPYAASELLSWMFMRVDLLIIALRLDKYSAGIYSSAESILNALFLIPNTVSFVIVPVLSSLFATDIPRAWRTAWRSLLVLALIGLGLFLLLLFGAPLVVFLLGPAYQETAQILQILSVVILFHSVSYGLGAILVATNQQARRSGVQFVSVIINVVLNLLIIDRTGIYGVAVVYAITEIVLICGYGWLVMRTWRGRAGSLRY